MKIYIKISLVLVAFLFMSMKGDKPAYMLYNADGKITNYKSLIKDASAADIVFFGELHDNSICHWMQIEITKDLYDATGGELILGAEMFETDNQLLMDEYISGEIPAKNFEGEAKLWKNYKTDYKPLVDFAKDNELPFIATNIPRRYASIVNKKGYEGLDSLQSDALKLIAPLPIDFDPEVECYKSMMEMMRGMGSHDTLNIAKAQAIKDATMAYSILNNWSEGKTFLHYNGSYHSDNYEGIVWWLKKENPNLNILTISTIEQDTITSLDEESHNVADYIMCTPSNMTKTYSSSNKGF